MNYYNTSVTVEYYNNQQYRQCLRMVFSMDITKSNEYIHYLETANNETLDEETEDEMLFDNDSVLKSLNFIFDKTKDNIAFIELYELAAAKMISQDLNIGMTICFSYDYFFLFHKYLVIFILEERIDMTKYTELKQLLEMK